MSLKLKSKKPNPRKLLNEKRAFLKEETNVDKISSELEQVGVDLFAPKELGGTLNIDSDYLSIPMDVTEITSQELGRYLNAFTSQKQYIRTLIGWQEIIIEDRKRLYYDVSLEKYKELSKSKMSEASKEREINGDLTIQPSFFDYKDSKQKLKLLTNNLLSLEDAVFLLSRELSRRSKDFEEFNRNENTQRR